MFLLQDESFLIEYIQAGQSERVWRTCIILNHELFYGGLRLWEGNERENYRGNRRKRNFIAFGDNLRRKMLEVMLLMKRKKAQGANNSISCMNSHQLYAGRKKIRREEGGKTHPTSQELIPKWELWCCPDCGIEAVCGFLHVPQIPLTEFHSVIRLKMQ